MEYEILEKIGHGSFGLIRKVRRRSDGQVLCRKEVSYVRMSQVERQQLYAEFSILSSLRHPNIVAYYHREHLKASQDLYLYMEYCGNGDLGRVIRQLKASNQYAEEDFVWSVFSQLVTALYRCHYGIDAPEVGRNVTVAGKGAKPVCVDGKKPVMILHRDLKPENVFLSEDNSVKLGDFGLSKIMQSHDFASTYVGTPFYMSPEICAAERYTLHSDIWSLGCVMYELCAREPPFNARTHFQLVQRIKDGRYPPLPAIYSPELQAVIKSCLQVNPRSRPDTAALLNLPVVRLMRKEREAVELGKTLKAKDELAAQRLRELEDRALAMQAEFELKRKELDASLRREWEVKARLEIERRVEMAAQQLEKVFEQELQGKVETELQRRAQAETGETDRSKAVGDIPSSSVSTQNDTDFPSTTELSSLSLDSPAAARLKPPPKVNRTPFGRSRTMFVGSPMDVQMVDPSPMSIACLSLSPRRQGLAVNGPSNIFSAADNSALPDMPVNSDDESDEELAAQPPSPSQRAAAKGNLKPQRPRLQTRMTAPVPKPNANTRAQDSSEANAKDKTEAPPLNPTQNVQLVPRADALRLGLAKEQRRPPANNRRLSKVPEGSGVVSNGSGSPVAKSRKALLPGRATAGPNVPAVGGGDDMHKAAVRNNMMRGRTLVELEQARLASKATAPRPSSSSSSSSSSNNNNNNKASAADENMGSSRAVEVVWDPERDEMPSPFLVRGTKGVRRT